MKKVLSFVKNNKWLLCILFVGALLRFYRIDYQSIWLDEIHTINEANPNTPLKDLYAAIKAGEQMPPLYFYTVYFLFKIFGYVPLVMRVYSAFLGIASLYALYLLGKEIAGKRVGLIAALLMCVNSYQLYYSQESRPYIFLLLFTTLSFYWLVRFIKTPTLRNAVIHGVFAALMINSHFFALFSLLAQYSVLLFFLIVSAPPQRKKFFLHALSSGLTTMVLFIPCIPILISVSEITEFWIPAPTWDSYTLIFREFFGNSEILLALTSILLVLYFFKISREKELPFQYSELVANRTIFGFIILAPWLFIVVLIPLIRSYTSLPVLISRYFIPLLPALFLLLAIALYQIKNSIVRSVFLCVLVVFSVTDILVVKKYYVTVSKSQFREVTSYIVQNNTHNDPVYTSLPWYFNYFLNNGETRSTILENSLENLANEISQDSTKIRSFWYVDAHNKPYALSEDKQRFMDAHFTVTQNRDAFDCWTRHYTAGKLPLARQDISQFSPIKDKNGDDFFFNIEKFEPAENSLTVSGWAFFRNESASESHYEVLLVSGNTAYKLPLLSVFRPDNTSYFKSKKDVSNSGFTGTIDLGSLPPGNYRLALCLSNEKIGKKGLVLTDKTVNKQ